MSKNTFVGTFFGAKFFSRVGVERGAEAGLVEDGRQWKGRQEELDNGSDILLRLAIHSQTRNRSRNSCQNF